MGLAGIQPVYRTKQKLQQCLGRTNLFLHMFIYLVFVFISHSQRVIWHWD